MKEIPLNRGLFVRVDADDWDAISNYGWYAARQVRKTVPDSWYVVAHIKTADGRTVTTSMHRLIMRPPKGMEVDHLDHDGLNNTRSNLRICTRSENMRNRRSAHRDLPRGVFVVRGICFGAQLMSRGKAYYNGLNHKTPEDAARAYNEMAIKHHGKFATLNVI